MSIAEFLHGKKFEEYKDGKLLVENQIWTFKDGSRAKVITRMEKCEPYLEMGVTKSFKEVKFWQAL